MRKIYAIILGTILLIIPSYTLALSLGTNIIGNEKVRPGSNIVYTVVLDYELTEYEAEVNYDRSVLNLVDVKEININTTNKEFLIEKSNPIKIKSTSSEAAKIVYTLEFNVKNYLKVNDTEVSIKTITAKNNDEELTASESYIKANIVNEAIFDDEEIETDKNKVQSLLNDIKGVMNDYGDPITYVSLGLNLLLITLLISSIRRKKVDYDF